MMVCTAVVCVPQSQRRLRLDWDNAKCENLKRGRSLCTHAVHFDRQPSLIQLGVVNFLALVKLVSGSLVMPYGLVKDASTLKFAARLAASAAALLAMRPAP